MKKIILISILGFFITLPLSSYALLDGDFWIDMYKKIDEGMTNMESKNYQYELTGQGKISIEDEFNKRLKSEWIPPCISSLSPEDIKKIRGWDVETLTKKLNPGCLGKNGSSVSNEQISQYIWGISKVDDSIIKNAEDKTRHTYELSRVWLYSDGSKENSPFDLVNDIQDIDDIIFCQNSQYNGKPLPNTSQRFSDLMRWVLRFIPWTNQEGSSSSSSSWWGTYSTETYTYTTKVTHEIITEVWSSGSIITPYACSYEINTGTGSSWLEKKTIEELIYWTWSKTTWTNSWSTWSWWTWKTSTWSTNNGNPQFNPWNYKQKNDNKQWECNQFFCIKIEFKMKNYKLLWGWKSVCIKSILESTDKNLKKFAGTSLIQSKMTKNNFELGLLDLNLPSILHLWVQVFKKPAPILNLEKQNETKIQDSEFKVKNLLSEKYKNIGLDYTRKNDLHEYKGKTDEYKSVLWCGELTNEECSQKVEDAYRQRVKAWFSERKNSFTSRAITERSNYQDSNDYFKEFTEIEKFWASLRDFVFNSSWIIRKMNEIPKNN